MGQRASRMIPFQTLAASAGPGKAPNSAPGSVLAIKTGGGAPGSSCSVVGPTIARGAGSNMRRVHLTDPR